MTFWHGGRAGLRIGDQLLPPIITQDQMSTSHFMNEARVDRVYFTTDRELARVFSAAVYTGVKSSALYRVQPAGDVEVDPDFAATGYQARRAVVLEVAETDVQLSEAERYRRTGRYLTWDDGRPMYDADGRLQVTRQMEQIGITQADLDSRFAPWVNPDEAAAALGGSLN